MNKYFGAFLLVLFLPFNLYSQFHKDIQLAIIGVEDYRTIESVEELESKLSILIKQEKIETNIEKKKILSELYNKMNDYILNDYIEKAKKINFGKEELFGYINGWMKYIMKSQTELPDILNKINTNVFFKSLSQSGIQYQKNRIENDLKNDFIDFENLSNELNNIKNFENYKIYFNAMYYSLLNNINYDLSFFNRITYLEYIFEYRVSNEDFFKNEENLNKANMTIVYIDNLRNSGQEISYAINDYLNYLIKESDAEGERLTKKLNMMKATIEVAKKLENSLNDGKIKND